MNEAQLKACHWNEDDDTCSWDTSCDNKFQFTNEGPIENEFKFCPFCGGAIMLAGRKPEAAPNAGNIADSVSANGSLAASSVKTQLAEMMAALDAGDSEKYWKNFEAVMSRHAELLDEVTMPENTESSDRESGTRSGKDVTD